MKCLANKSALVVWCARLSEYRPTEMAALFASIGKAEQQQADKFRCGRRRNSFIVGRYMVYQAYRHLYPQFDIAIHQDENAKPVAFHHGTALPHRFNLSHSGEYVVLAISNTGRVGVDVECVDTTLINQGMARSFMSAEELQQYWALPASQQQTFFFRLWTIKEALLKAIGVGLRCCPRAVSIGSVMNKPFIKTLPALYAHAVFSLEVLNELEQVALAVVCEKSS